MSSPCKNISTLDRGLRASLLWRLVWLLMLLIHAKPVGMAVGLLGNQPFSSTRTLVWTLVSAFFILKVVDVRWLRLGTNERAKLSWLVIIGLVHLGVLNRTLETYDNSPNGNLVIVLFMGGATVATPVLGLLHLAMAGRSLPRPRLDASFHSHRTWCAISHSWCRISRTCPRGPPFFQLITTA